MTDFELSLMNMVWGTARDYGTNFPFSAVTKAILKLLAEKNLKGTVEKVNKEEQRLTVSGHVFRILRHKDYSRYDVIMVR